MSIKQVNGKIMSSNWLHTKGQGGRVIFHIIPVGKARQKLLVEITCSSNYICMKPMKLYFMKVSFLLYFHLNSKKTKLLMKKVGST